MNQWRLVITQPWEGLPGAMNMAVDEAIMKAVAQGRVPPTIRFYSWQPPAVTLGYFQKAEKEIDLAACRVAGVDVVRRLTGGRAVFHQHEFTYSLAARENCQQIKGSVLESYLAISQGLIEGLRAIGVSAGVAEGKKQPKSTSAACFDAPSWYELVVDGRKLIGSAQTRREGCILQHGSLPLKIDLELFFSLLYLPSEGLRERLKRNYIQKAAALEQFMEAVPPMEALHKAFVAGFEKALEIDLCPEGLTAYEEKLAVELCDVKYNQDSWNLKR